MLLQQSNDLDRNTLKSVFLSLCVSEHFVASLHFTSSLLNYSLFVVHIELFLSYLSILALQFRLTQNSFLCVFFKSLAVFVVFEKIIVFLQSALVEEPFFIVYFFIFSFLAIELSWHVMHTNSMRALIALHNKTKHKIFKQTNCILQFLSRFTSLFQTINKIFCVGFRRNRYWKIITVFMCQFELWKCIISAHYNKIKRPSSINVSLTTESRHSVQDRHIHAFALYELRSLRYYSFVLSLSLLSFLLCAAVVFVGFRACMGGYCHGCTNDTSKWTVKMYDVYVHSYW